MTNVFLSYGRADGSAAALKLRGELEQAGFTVWQDIRDMQGGKEWRDQLRQAISRVNAVLVLLTPASGASRYVEMEWQLALTLGRRVIPLLILPCDVPDDLKPIHYHNLSQPDKYTMGLMALMRDLNALPPSETANSKTTPAPATPAPGNRIYNTSGTIVNSQFGDQNTMTNTNTTVSASTAEMAQTLAFVQQTFSKFTEDLKQQDAATQLMLADLIQKAKTEAIQIENGNASPDHETRFEKFLGTLQIMGGDIGEVFITTLANPPAGINLVIQKIAQRVKKNAAP